MSIEVPTEGIIISLQMNDYHQRTKDITPPYNKDPDTGLVTPNARVAEVRGDLGSINLISNPEE